MLGNLRRRPESAIDTTTPVAISGPPLVADAALERFCAYPSALVLGIDLDEASVTEARARAAEAGVTDRVRFVVGDASQVTSEAPFDLVTSFEALHDMGDPVATLRAAHALLTADGNVLVADERVADAFTAPGDPVERVMYGWSVLHCLPATLAEALRGGHRHGPAPPPSRAGPLRIG